MVSEETLINLEIKHKASILWHKLLGHEPLIKSSLEKPDGTIINYPSTIFG